MKASGITRYSAPLGELFLVPPLVNTGLTSHISWKLKDTKSCRLNKPVIKLQACGITNDTIWMTDVLSL